ncbi:MAG TPA: hypothetical protein VMT61_03840 [Candidatus Binataceae bacterium]|nr:hypothetical protein [Candidatus Binataceae bacterium]
MSPTAILIAQKLFEIISLTASDVRRSEADTIEMIGDRIFADAKLVSTLIGLAPGEMEELYSLLRRGMAASRAPRS